MDQAVAERIRSDITSNDVVLYMNGTPVFPQCGGSAQAVQILNMIGVQYKSIDVMTSAGIRQGIKDFSNWPTIPQLYIRGEFIGGNDIMRAMLETGELQALLESK
ncbi:MAG: Grx4 family monothiol glutaredoxin [Alphaproteobacteria bacterium]|nr:Grx4 family monothiol glutaredoxin [Alphaproteobacteria bacterium]